MARQGYLLSFEAEPHLPLILKDNYQTKKRKKEQENKKEKKITVHGLLACLVCIRPISHLRPLFRHRFRSPA